MELSDLKLVYFRAQGELRKVGKNYLLKHYLSTYNNTIILLHGYTLKGSQKIIALDERVEITDENKEQSLRDQVFAILKN